MKHVAPKPDQMTPIESLYKQPCPRCGGILVGYNTGVACTRCGTIIK